MNAEIVASGTELLLGEIVDTNSAHIARELRNIGVNIYFKSVVGDNMDRMAQVLDIALSRADVVIITGGLGPTQDDITRDAIAKVTNRPLVVDERQLGRIEAIFARWGRPMGMNNRRQAFLPAGARGIDNPVGTAPGILVEDERGTLIALAGVPREMKHLLETEVIPYLKSRMDESAVIVAKVLRTIGIGESSVDQVLAELMTLRNPTVGLAAHPGQTDVRITAKARTPEEAERMIADIEAEVRRRLGQYVYGVAQESIEEVVMRHLQQRGWSLSLAETSTQGDIAARLRTGPNANGTLRALATWANDLAEAQSLGVSVADAAAHRTPAGVSALAQALQRQSGADLALVLLGSTGADEGVYAQRAGETHAALASRDAVAYTHYAMGGTDDVSRHWVANRALDWLRRVAESGQLSGG